MMAFIIDMFVTQMSQKTVDENSESKALIENNESVLEGSDVADTNNDDLPSIDIRPPADSIVILEKKDNNENELSSFNFSSNKEEMTSINKPLLSEQ